MSDHVTETLSDAVHGVTDAVDQASHEIFLLEGALGFIVECVRKPPGPSLLYSDLLGKWYFDPGPDGKEGYGYTIREAILAAKSNSRPEESP